MNDRYLFKAKRKMWRKFPKEEHWIVWDTITGKPSEAILNETICQCTGLKGKNGTLIWENDIVSTPREDGYSLICWDDTEAKWEMHNEIEGIALDFNNYWANEIEVCGNIFDNPELLEVE